MKIINFNKNQASGVTLISLTVTIIVLTILAGTSIHIISSEDGILKQTTEVVDESVQKSIEEEIELAIAKAKMEYGGNLENVASEEEYIKEYLNNYRTSSGATITYNDDGSISYKKDGKTKTVKVNLETGQVEM